MPERRLIHRMHSALHPFDRMQASRTEWISRQNSLFYVPTFAIRSGLYFEKGG